MNRLMDKEAKDLNTFFGQPAPTINTRPAVWDLVMQDMKARNEFGKQKYGTPLQAFNGRDALKDAYEEALDLCVYLRTAMEERDNPGNVYE
jgi:hypothetical protein